MLNSNDAASTSACDCVRAQTGEESKSEAANGRRRRNGRESKRQGFQEGAPLDLKLSWKSERLNKCSLEECETCYLQRSFGSQG